LRREKWSIIGDMLGYERSKEEEEVVCQGWGTPEFPHTK
jgi:hypothetical protein